MMHGNGFHHVQGRSMDEFREHHSHSPVPEDVGITAQPRTAQKNPGRMCFGVSLPGTGHTAYVFEILTSTGQTWKVTRRYSDFVDLHQKLLQMFGKPTRPFPPLPKKVIVGSQSSKVIEERQRMLTTYLQAVLDNKILSSTTEVRKFVDMKGDDEDVPVSVFRTNIPRPGEYKQ
ncbi:hypothetical protein GUITHDRAFT_152146 [Guillardia theta CCMP2712]|uniref:PX domain-containing protein n=1 Tax=Guillardia theta (strain CCMP2712) TaxID=905079 RepID=L1JEU2_GUITC|nr:hypothetical protein GUITHDRAFT_152146 [Guillardia theta CCMP2712]EKX47063.1 hypothetical protein GUITHDRAFT_152146 [Guillardia theta CCMP2712]|eukprot:XP_005834043.1 hypothetical protein GUITHDRAFT_152146 [Guillardia theta CCMP2712]